MSTGSIQSIIEQVKSLEPDEQLAVAEAIDRMTWAQRWRRICTQIESRLRPEHAPTDAELDELVDGVRQEKPLSARSSTRRS